MSRIDRHSNRGWGLRRVLVWHAARVGPRLDSAQVSYTLHLRKEGERAGGVTPGRWTSKGLSQDLQGPLSGPVPLLGHGSSKRQGLARALAWHVTVGTQAWRALLLLLSKGCLASLTLLRAVTIATAVQCLEWLGFAGGVDCKERSTVCCCAVSVLDYIAQDRSLLRMMERMEERQERWTHTADDRNGMSWGKWRNGIVCAPHLACISEGAGGCRQGRWASTGVTQSEVRIAGSKVEEGGGGGVCMWRGAGRERLPHLACIEERWHHHRPHECRRLCPLVEASPARRLQVHKTEMARFVVRQKVHLPKVCHLRAGWGGGGGGGGGGGEG
eukprot:358893-Chlamydomonas_euryale.AAC.6